MRKISGIVSVGPSLEIGANSRLLYPNKTDMAFFCGYTQGKLVIMGRKTAETILSSLPGRDVMVVSRTPETALNASPCARTAWDGYDFSEVVDASKGRDIVVVGGGEIYSMFSGMYEEFYITINTTKYDGVHGPADAFFDEECLSGLNKVEKVFESSKDRFSIHRYYRDMT